MSRAFIGQSPQPYNAGIAKSSWAGFADRNGPERDQTVNKARSKCCGLPSFMVGKCKPEQRWPNRATNFRFSEER